MISVQGVGETVSVVRYNVLDTKGRVWEGSGIASFLVLGGGGGGDSQMYRQKSNLHARASASEAYTFSGLKIHLHNIQSMQFTFTTCGMAL